MQDQHYSAWPKTGFVAALALISLHALSAQAQIKTKSVKPDSQTYVLPKENAQAVMAATAVQPARYVATQDSDRALTNHCVEGGYDKKDCLCVTQVLKYELPLRDYDAAALVFALQARPDGSDETLSRDAAKTKLYQNGHSETELAALNAMSRSLVNAADFAQRCQKAAAFFRTAKGSGTTRGD